jgi:hypothetical protein
VAAPFPAKHSDVRPLEIGAAGEIATVMGWSLPYTLGVLGRWKLTPVYCRAVLCHDRRIALDGTPARGGRRRSEGAGEEAARLAARKAAASAAKPTEPPAPPPKPLRDLVRASLLRRSA